MFLKGCRMCSAMEQLIRKKKKNQVQFIFRVQRKYKRDAGTKVQIFLWKKRILQEEIQFKEEGDEGEDYRIRR